jgi:hypothetical protein
MTTITNNFEDVQNLIKMAYDFYYNKNKTLCYEVKPVNISDVEKIDSIKRNLVGVSSGQIFINSILNDRLEFVKKIITIFGYKYILKKNNDPHSVNIVLYIYNNDEKNNIYSSQNINKVFMKLFSDFLSYELTRHIQLQILNVDLLMSDLDELITNIVELKPLLDIENVLGKTVSVSIIEHFFKMDSLDNFLDSKLLKKWSNSKDEIEFITLIFQVIHTLAIIQNKYPNFRHNNLNVKFIDGYIQNVNDVKIPYSFNGTNYLLPNNGFIYKMNNFESSIIVDTIINENLDDDLRTIDQFYDVNTFLTSLKKHIDSFNISIPKKTSVFINKYIDNKKDNINASTILNDEYFNLIKNIENSIDLKKNKRNIKINKKNKLSIHKLSGDMNKKPAFLHKGTRQINNNTNEKKVKQQSVVSGTRQIDNSRKSYEKDQNVMSGSRKLNKELYETKNIEPSFAHILSNDNLSLQHNNKPLHNNNNNNTVGNNRIARALGGDNAQFGMANMGMPPLGAPNMGMPPLGSPNMELPPLGAPNMGMVDIGMQQLRTPQIPPIPQMADIGMANLHMQMPQIQMQQMPQMQMQQMSSRFMPPPLPPGMFFPPPIPSAAFQPPPPPPHLPLLFQPPPLPLAFLPPFPPPPPPPHQ